MSLTGVIASFGKSYNLTRGSAGAWVGGDFVPGSTSVIPIVAVIQPLSGRNLQLLPEGHHASETMLVRTTTELRTVTGSARADIITYKGEAWNVIAMFGWEAFGAGTSGDHYKGLIARVVA